MTNMLQRMNGRESYSVGGYCWNLLLRVSYRWGLSSEVIVGGYCGRSLLEVIVGGYGWRLLLEDIAGGHC